MESTEGEGRGKKGEDAKEGRQSEARGENSAKQEYLLMEEEQEANLYIAQKSLKLTCLGVHSNSLCDLHNYFWMRNVQVYLL